MNRVRRPNRGGVALRTAVLVLATLTVSCLKLRVDAGPSDAGVATMRDSATASPGSVDAGPTPPTQADGPGQDLGAEATPAPLDLGAERASGDQGAPIDAMDAAPTTARMLGGTDDPKSDWLDGMIRPDHMDIRNSRVFLVDGGLRFEMDLQADVPSAVTTKTFYGWFVDTDMNASTGQRYNDIGSDFNVQLDHQAVAGWTGIVYNISAGGATLHTTFVVDGPRISLTIPLSALGHPTRFRYVSIDQQADGSGYCDIAPNMGSVSASTL